VNEQTIFDIQAELCRAMGNPLRMEIMHLLRTRPLSVNDIASATHQHQATISRNLTKLRNAGIVVSRREGANIFYQVANPKLMRACDMMREVLNEQVGEWSKLIESHEE
jgi:ArsR family transcriptional regulator, virulence genes transcriptional regulator